jgi:peptidoglycan/LPS O-acetylase OafA/YrhL
METKTVQRRFDLDWLRVLVILTVFIYHTTRFFTNEPWLIQNPTRYLVMDILETTIANWNMALIFVISGASLFFAVGKGGVVKFIKDKVLRLLVPFVMMGMLAFGVWQVYLGRLTHREFSGSFLAFIPHYFQPDNFAWTGAHLWYLEMLFIFCLIFLPLFLWLKRGSGQYILGKAGDLLALPGAVYLLVLPTILCLGLTDRENFLGNTDWGGGSILSHATFFLSGFLIISHEGLQKNIQRFRWLSFALIPILMITIFSLFFLFGEPPSGTLAYALGRALWGFWSWCWVLAILGFSMKHLNFNRSVLTYANEAVLPFYILHQPVLLSVGYFVVQWTIPAAAKFIIIDTLSFVFIMALYEFVVRRVNLLRFLFGMKLHVTPARVQANETQLKESARTV